ncbi:MAG TPA: hypothetical protein VER14_04935 [Phototrophicaceae bacterium]|nr:hypothetical protein [Phototrophicaceae bacterium]
MEQNCSDDGEIWELDAINPIRLVYNLIQYCFVRAGFDSYKHKLRNCAPSISDKMHTTVKEKE